MDHNAATRLGLALSRGGKCDPTLMFTNKLLNVAAICLYVSFKLSNQSRFTEEESCSSS